MALFQKKQDFSTSAPLYSLSNDKTYLIIGLGNPGKEYERTRHNIGFDIVEFFATKNDFPPFSEKKSLKSELSMRNIGNTRVILMKPQTFMNLSGQAVQAVQQFYKIDNAHTLVVYDELALPFGQLRTRVGGSDAGHNGVKSLIEYLGDPPAGGFGRLRVGIAGQNVPKDTASYVLKKFSKGEQAKVPMTIRETNGIINEFILGGVLNHDTKAVEI